MKRLFAFFALSISCAAHAVVVDGWNVQYGSPQIVPTLVWEQEVETYTGDIMIHKTEQKPADGNVYVIVPVTILKTDKNAAIFKPANIQLKTSNQIINRLADDAFLIDYNITPLTQLNVRLGAHKGSIIFEVPQNLANQKVALLYNTTSMELK